MPSRRTVIGAGLAAAGLAGGVAAGQARLRRSGSRAVAVPPAPDRLLEARVPADVEVHTVPMSDGACLRVLARGAGPPIVLVHGVALSAEVWHKQLHDLSDGGFRVVAPDLRGHGRSTVGSGGLHLDRVADDLAELLERLDLDDVVLVGHSLGGMLVLRLLTRDAPAAAAGAGALRRVTVSGPGHLHRRVRALALVATSASPVVGRGVPGARAVIALAGPVLGATGRLVRWLPGPSLPDTNAGDPLAGLTFGSDPAIGDIRLIRRLTAEVPARVAASLLVQLVSFDAERQLGRVAVPTTVVVGTEDVMTPLRHAETLAAAIPRSELVVLAGCGHMVMLERPALLAAALLELGGARPADGVLRRPGQRA